MPVCRKRPFTTHADLSSRATTSSRPGSCPCRWTQGCLWEDPLPRAQGDWHKEIQEDGGLLPLGARVRQDQGEEAVRAPERLGLEAHLSVLVELVAVCPTQIERHELLDLRVGIHLIAVECGLEVVQLVGVRPKLELLQDVVDVRRKPSRYASKSALSCCWLGAGLQITQRELRRVVECLAGGLTQGLVLVDDRRLVERGLNIER